MKKLLGILAVCALTASAFAQGTVGLRNQSGLLKQWTSTSDSTLISVPKSGGYVYLIAAPVGTALPNPLFNGKMNYSSLAGFLSANPGWASASGPIVGDTTAYPALIAAAAGVVNGGTYTINNVAAGGNAAYFLLGWTGAAASVDAAITAWNGGLNMFGESAIATTATGNPLATPPGTATLLTTSFAGMTMSPLPVIIPEPTTFALAGLGAAALMIFRRRK